MGVSNTRKFIIFILVVLLAVAQEADARRTILRGRKTLTRYFMRENALPAWAVMVLIGLGQLVIGAGLFVLLKWCVLDRAIKPRYRLAPTTPTEV